MVITGEGALWAQLAFLGAAEFCVHLVQPVYSCVAAADLVLPYEPFGMCWQGPKADLVVSKEISSTVL